MGSNGLYDFNGPDARSCIRQCFAEQKAGWAPTAFIADACCGGGVQICEQVNEHVSKRMYMCIYIYTHTYISTRVLFICVSVCMEAEGYDACMDLTGGPQI